MMTESGTALAALSIEARRRGMTYGQLTGATSREEQRQIIEKYIRQRAEARRRKKKFDPGI